MLNIKDLTKGQQDYLVKNWSKYSVTKDGVRLTKKQTFQVFANKFGCSVSKISDWYYELIYPNETVS